jgi:cytidylate kinase
MRIITISREFGSGGRELGKRLAELLGYDYYDREIITAIAKKHDMNEGFVENALENHWWQSVPLTYRNSFAAISPMQEIQTALLVEERNVIESIASAGKNCVIVGRNADVRLKDYQPFRIFVCAEMDAKIKRCIERGNEGEDLSEKTIKKNIKTIDKNRARNTEIITGNKWGDPACYDLVVNTTKWSIKELVPAVAEYADKFFDIIDITYNHIYGSVPFTPGMRKMMLQNFNLIVDLKNVAVILDENDRVVCFGICFPSIAKSVQKCQGKLTPLGALRILWEIKHPKVIDLGLIGVLPEYAMKGVSSSIISTISKMLKYPNIDHIETNLTLETNISIINQFKSFKTVQHKRRRSFVKKID